MASDIIVILEDGPGTLADAGEALGRAGINIQGACLFPYAREWISHLLVEDATAARQALEQAGLTVRGPREVLVLDVEDRPGQLGALGRRMANAGVNIELVYITSDGRFVLGVDDLEKARSAV